MIKTASCKSKARRLQQWVCQRLSAVSGIEWGPEDDREIQSRPMSQSGVDVILRGKAREAFPFSFECQSGESFQLAAKVQQARKNEEQGRPWVIVHKRKKFRNPIVMMDWETFERLVQMREDIDGI